ncbi:XVIPCD domain-containing protein [Stenotrophomonas maltophilia]|uniref:XVIPCD domain-containing protein n=1 Tax=Stenotrophomonas maltophilia TaxID=40324 RepID=UPI0039F72DE8
MNKDDRHTLTIYLAAPGTPLAGGGSSLTGHMYLVTQHGEEAKSFGLQPDGNGPAVGWMDEKFGAVPAGVSNRDLRDYKDPYYARTIEISKEQYEKIQEFAADPAAYGFDMKYHGVTHSCTDFAWAAMNHAGIHRQTWMGADKDYEGQMKVLFNLPEVQSIKPPFPDSDLNTEHYNEMPERDWRQKMLSENEAPALSPERAVASSSTDARHSNDPLLAQINQGVARLNAERGHNVDTTTSENVSASLYALAKANGLTQVDHVLLSDRTAQADAAQNIFIVQGERNDPAHLRASMPTVAAAQTPADASFERAEQLSQSAQVRAQEELQQRQVQEQSGPRMV